MNHPKICYLLCMDHQNEIFGALVVKNSRDHRLYEHRDSERSKNVTWRVISFENFSSGARDA